MQDKQYFYDYLIKMLSIAKIGLIYSTDAYALNNYKQVQEETMKMLQNFENVSFDRLNYFERNVYPTPNVSARAVVINENKEILLVQEKNDHGYSIPGGWCDLYDSPSDAIAREALEEAGIKIKIKRLACLMSRTPYKAPCSVPEYALIFEAEIIENLHTHDHEIENVDFFPLDNLPKLSGKITQEEFDKIVDAILNNKTLID